MKYFFKLVFGLIFFLITKKNTNWGYQAMIHYFCKTGGKSNDLLTKMIAYFRGKTNFSDSNGILGNLEKEDRNKIQEHLTSKGHYLFDKKLPSLLIKRLHKFALETPSMPRSYDKEKTDLFIGEEKKTLFSEKHSHYNRLDIPQKELLKNQDIQGLMADHSLLNIAQDYLGCTPILDIVAMWWLKGNPENLPQSNSAQLFHFDMDRVKWLKFFIYLTDVNEDNGPHCFIERTQQTMGIPKKLLDKGYERLTDEEVFQHIPRSQYREHIAPAGSIIAEDTRGLHKGKHVTGKARLLLQFEFTNYCFGSSGHKEIEFPDSQEIKAKNLKEGLEVFSPVYQFYR